MVQDEDGSFGQVYREDLDYEGEPRDLDALFSESVYQSSDGMSLHLVRQGDGGPTVFRSTTSSRGSAWPPCRFWPRTPPPSMR